MSEAASHEDLCECDECALRGKRARHAAEMRAYRMRRKTNPEHVEHDRKYFRLKARERRERDPESIREANARWREKDIAHANELAYKWRREHPEWNERRNLARNAQRAALTPEQRHELDHAHYRRYKATYNARAREYRQRNRERMRAYQVIKNANRRARLKHAGGSWSWDQFRGLCDLMGGRCYYCGATPDKLTPDHAIPLSRGGSNDITNLVPACLSCNVSKGRLTADEYHARLLEDA